MEFRVEEIAPCKKKVTITVPAERVKEEFDAQYREVNKAIAIPGFRPGHVPRKLLETRFGPKIADEVKHKIVERAYESLVKDKKLQPLSRPSVDVESTPVAADKPFEFGFEVVVRPEFTLPEWKGREVKVPEITVSDADVDAGVERLRASEGDLVPSEGAATADDVVVLTWSAKDGDTSLASGEGTYYRIGQGVLEGFLAEGLDAALVGSKSGDKAKVRGRAATDDTRPLLAGKEFDVWVEVTEVKRFEPAPLDAEFLKRHDYDDVDELRKDVRRKIARLKERGREVPAPGGGGRVGRGRLARAPPHGGHRRRRRGGRDRQGARRERRGREDARRERPSAPLRPREDLRRGGPEGLRAGADRRDRADGARLAPPLGRDRRPVRGAARAPRRAALAPAPPEGARDPAPRRAARRGGAPRGGAQGPLPPHEGEVASRAGDQR
jgi:trigger factor protein